MMPQRSPLFDNNGDCEYAPRANAKLGHAFGPPTQLAGDLALRVPARHVLALVVCLLAAAVSVFVLMVVAVRHGGGRGEHRGERGEEDGAAHASQLSRVIPPQR